MELLLNWGSEKVKYRGFIYHLSKHKWSSMLRYYCTDNYDTMDTLDTMDTIDTMDTLDTMDKYDSFRYWNYCYVVGDN